MGLNMTQPPLEPRGESRPAECLDLNTLLAFMQGRLDPQARDAVELHIDGCEDCLALQNEASLGAASTLESFRPTAGALPNALEVAGRYRVERFVARGGMGDIYAVRDRVLDEDVALKTITAASMNDVKAILRLKAEVKLARRVCSRHTCRIFDYGEHEDRSGVIPFLTMEFIEGESLGHRLRKQGKLAPERAVVIARQLLEGLLAAHAVGVLHRDFKSDNVMLRAASAEPASEHAVIMDFGLARALHEDGDRLTSHTQALLGSAAYMAPEQVECSELTERADVYAFGVVLFEMLTGTLPFRGGSPLATALLRLRSGPPRPSELVPELHPLWDELVMGCLQRQAAKRMSCEQALELLASIAKASGQKPQRRARRYTSRASAFAWGAACTLACCVLGAAAWPRSPWLHQETQAAYPAPRPPPPSAPAPAPIRESQRTGAEAAAWLLEAAQPLAEHWRRNRDELACRQASALFNRALEHAPAGGDASEAARRALRELGTCAARAPSSRTSARPAKATQPGPSPASRGLPSEDPVDGLFGPAPGSSP
jgi:serine/threonine protein kinase